MGVPLTQRTPTVCLRSWRVSALLIITSVQPTHGNPRPSATRTPTALEIPTAAALAAAATQRAPRAQVCGLSIQLELRAAV